MAIIYKDSPLWDELYQKVLEEIRGEREKEEKRLFSPPIAENLDILYLPPKIRLKKKSEYVTTWSGQDRANEGYILKPTVVTINGVKKDMGLPTAMEVEKWKQGWTTFSKAVKDDEVPQELQTFIGQETDKLIDKLAEEQKQGDITEGSTLAMDSLSALEKQIDAIDDNGESNLYELGKPPKRDKEAKRIRLENLYGGGNSRTGSIVYMANCLADFKAENIKGIENQIETAGGEFVFRDFNIVGGRSDVGEPKVAIKYLNIYYRPSKFTVQPEYLKQYKYHLLISNGKSLFNENRRVVVFTYDQEYTRIDPEEDSVCFRAADVEVYVVRRLTEWQRDRLEDTVFKFYQQYVRERTTDMSTRQYNF